MTKLAKMIRNSVIFLNPREFIAVLKLTLVFRSLVEPKMRQPLRVLMDLVKDAPSTTNWDADSPNGEQYSKSEKGYLQM